MDWPLVGRDAELAELGAALSTGTSIVLAGEAGVGKTRLASELVSRSSHSRPLHSAVGTESARRLPFGAVAHLLPPLPTAAGQTAMLQAAVAAIGSTAEPIPLLMIDDAHLLDPESATLAHTLGAHGQAQIVATVRTGAPAPDAVMALWKDGYCQRFDIGHVDRPTVAELLVAVLDGPVEERSLQWFWESSQGNLQYLREMVIGALESDTLRSDDGLWRLAESPGASPRLVELVQARLSRLDADSRAAVEALALAEPLGLEILQGLSGDVLGQLERQGIVRTVRSGRRVDARLGHPVHAEVLRNALAPSQRRPLLRQLVAALKARGARRTDDAMRLAVWSLDGGGEVDPEVLVAAGRRAAAVQDYPLAEELARTALLAGETFDARLLLADVLISQRQGAFAAESLGNAETLACNDAQRVALALSQAEKKHFVDDDPRAAIAILRRAADQVPEIDAAPLRFRAGLLVFMLGDTVALEQLSDIASGGDAPQLANALIGHSLAQVMTGQMAAASESIAAGSDLLREEPPTAVAPVLLGMNKAMLDLYSGRVTAAATAALTGYQAALESGAMGSAGLMAMMAAEAMTFSGTIEESARRFQEAAWLVGDADPFAVAPLCWAGVARTQAQAGNLDLATQTLARFDDDVASNDVREQLTVDHARVWLHALGGDLGQAVELARTCALRTVEASHPVWGAVVLHAAVRLGRPDAATELLSILAEEIDSELIATMARHAEALAAADAALLGDVVGAYDQMGATLYAAEAAAQAAGVLHDHGRRGDARRWRNRSLLLAAKCPGARTPALTEPALSAREREVALLAAGGMASRAIAHRLDVSPRTVENHLAAIYRKLGAQGRGELSELLYPDGSWPS